jgi:hypothetical protein
MGRAENRTKQGGKPEGAAVAGEEGMDTRRGNGREGRGGYLI